MYRCVRPPELLCPLKSSVCYLPPQDHPSIKSLLAHSTERRIRSKQHLAFVSSRPCLVCEQTPCHAHHITYAQPRGLSVKVSDEFTVPLCIAHHNQVHQAKPERSWWVAQGLEPLEIAATLWQETLRGLISQVVTAEKISA
ncbi:MAG: DUF968 domain-containing protein [Alphaproteobacteria bacterium]|nr:DUF968 domain-containing protein [Alphaproteobacteria bacterium]